MRDEADPALFARWVRGWTKTRGHAPPVAVPGGWRADAFKPDHRWRFLYPGPVAEIGVRARTPATAPFFLKVAAAAGRIVPLLPPGWRIDVSTCMMTREPSRSIAPTLPGDGRLAWSAPFEDVVRLEIGWGAVDRVASGQIALVDGMAVFDKIETEPGYRRRGLGRAVMTRLGQAADERGAELWMLAATAEGAALYATLGWQRHSPYLTAMPPSAPV